MATADFDDDRSPKGGKKGDGRLHCVVVTPEKTIIDEIAQFVALPLTDGEIGILPGRSPLIGRLGYGELRTRDDGEPRRYFVDGGFVEVRDDVVTVLTGRAIPSAQVDATAASAELQKALSRVATGDVEVADKERAVERARAQIRIAQSRA